MLQFELTRYIISMRARKHEEDEIRENSYHSKTPNSKTPNSKVRSAVNTPHSGLNSNNSEDLMDTDYGYSMQSQPVSGFGSQPVSGFGKGGGVTFEGGDKLSDALTSSCTPGNVLVIYCWTVLLYLYFLLFVW
jgi:hypothetical protein